MCRNKQRVLVTGANGFVGRQLCEYLYENDFEVVGAVRSREPRDLDRSYRTVSVGDIGESLDWRQHLDGVDSVVHLASRVHIMRETESDPLNAFRRVNVFGSDQLLSSIEPGRVKRFIFISTIKVHGEQSSDRSITVSDDLRPQDPYSVSKCEAEKIVEKRAREKGVAFTIIRPPIVYGAGVGGNFRRLMSLVESGVPLPLGCVRNQRSMAGVRNLCDLVRESLVNDRAVNKTLLVSDNADISTPDLIRKIACAMSKPDRVIPVPLVALKAAGVLLRRQSEIDRLIESLVVNVRETLEVLGWNPPYTIDQELSETVRWYQEWKRNE